MKPAEVTTRYCVYSEQTRMDEFYFKTKRAAFKKAKSIGDFSKIAAERYKYNSRRCEYWWEIGAWIYHKGKYFYSDQKYVFTPDEVREELKHFVRPQT